MSEIDYRRTLDYQAATLTLTMFDGTEITVNRDAIAYVKPYPEGAVINFGHSPDDGGLIVRESYADLRRLLRGEDG